MQRLCKFLLSFSLLAACSRTLGGAPDATSSAGRSGNAHVDAGGVGFLSGIGGAGGRGFGLGLGGGDIGSAGSLGAGGDGGDRVSTTGAGGGPSTARDAAPATGDASDGASSDASDPFCAIPSALTVGVTNVALTWCDAAQTCAQCSWKTGGSIGGGGMPTSPCALPPLLCPPPTSGAIAAGGVFPICTAHPDGETYQGVLVQLIGTSVVAPSVTVATSCSGLDDEGAGDLPVFGFDVTPCGLGRPTCVADCTDCP